MKTIIFFKRLIIFAIVLVSCSSYKNTGRDTFDFESTFIRYLNLIENDFVDLEREYIAPIGQLHPIVWHYYIYTQAIYWRLFYGLCDVTGNGVDDLIIGAVYRNNPTTHIIGIYTLVNRAYSKTIFQ